MYKLDYAGYEPTNKPEYNGNKIICWLERNSEHRRNLHRTTGNYEKDPNGAEREAHSDGDAFVTYFSVR